MVSGSDGPSENPWFDSAIPCSTSSRQIAGQPIAAANRCAGVVLPGPGGPLITINVGRAGAPSAGVTTG